jgi:hypothetical protein
MRQVNSQLYSPASCAMSAEVEPSRMEMPNRLRIVAFSSSPET